MITAPDPDWPWRASMALAMPVTAADGNGLLT